MRIGVHVAFALALCALGVALVPAKAADAMKDEQVGKYFLFAGLNIRIDRIETVAKVDGNPILSNIGDWGAYAHSDTQGYLLVHMTSQNPSSSEDRGVNAGNCAYYIGYELADGSERNTDRGADRIVMGKNNIEVARWTSTPPQGDEGVYQCPSGLGRLPGHEVVHEGERRLHGLPRIRQGRAVRAHPHPRY